MDLVRRPVVSGPAVSSQWSLVTNCAYNATSPFMEAGFTETRAAIHFSYAELERRIQELEGNYAALSERVGRLEARTA